MVNNAIYSSSVIRIKVKPNLIRQGKRHVRPIKKIAQTSYFKKTEIFHKYKTNSEYLSAVSHIPQFGDAASPTEDVDVSAGDAHL
jgi:hypothetical protein